MYPSGYSILIDVMEPSWNTCNGAKLVAAKVEAILGHTHVYVPGFTFVAVSCSK